MDKKYWVEADDSYIGNFDFMWGTNWLIIALVYLLIGLLLFRDIEFTADRPKFGF